MKFKLRRTSAKVFIDSEKKARNWIFREDWEKIEGKYEIGFEECEYNFVRTTIEINTMEELMKLQAIVKHPLIIWDDCIEIYDDYRE